MRRPLLLIVSSTLLGSATAIADTVADLDLYFIRETDEVAAVLCFGDEVNDCGPWAHHYLWEARVRRHVEGDRLPKRFKVLFGHHALRKISFRLTGAKVQPAEGSQRALAPYVVLESQDLQGLPNNSLERSRDR